MKKGSRCCIFITCMSTAADLMEAVFLVDVDFVMLGVMPGLRGWAVFLSCRDRNASEDSAPATDPKVTCSVSSMQITRALGLLRPKLS
jgi:hypothetical protein